MLDNIGDLSKPVTTLINKVSNAVGLMYEPTHLVRIARAEVAADKIRAMGELEITDIQRRGLERLIHQEGRKQANIEQITSQAVKLLPQDAEVDALDEDWVAHFFERCNIVSDKEMQTLWAKLLSGEAAQPGTFSKRTVNLVSSIDKKDAALFTSLCQFAWFFSEDSEDSDDKDIIPLIYNVEDDVYKKQGIDYLALLHLDSIGLISIESKRVESCGHHKYSKLSYYNRSLIIEFPKATDNTLVIGYCMLTSTGKELAPISGSKPNQEFYEYSINKWRSFGLGVVEMDRTKSLI